MNMHVPSSPALDAAEAVKPATMVQDWEQMVSPGHVLRDRLIERSKGGFLKATAAALGAIVLMSFSPSVLSLAPFIAAPVGLFMPNPNTYTDLGDGGRVSYRYAWLADVPAQAGLSISAFDQLHDAVRDDVNAFGGDAASWQQTAELAIAPRITRPQRVFEADALDRLSTGVVGLYPTAPERPVSLIAFVDGRLRWTVFGPGRCAVLLGPERDGCQTLRPGSSGDALSIIDAAKLRAN